MVYCNFKSGNGDFAVYSFGDSPTNTPGEVIFYKDSRMPVVQKPAEKTTVGLVSIARIYRKYKNDFEKGIFKEKLAYEIG